MSTLSDLERRLVALREHAAQRTAEERRANEARMAELSPLRARFERVVSGWMTDAIVPRLHMLARVLPQSGRVEHLQRTFEATVKLAWNHELGVGASLIVSIVPVHRFEQACVQIRPLFVPMLSRNPAPSSGAFDLQDEPSEALAAFLDAELVAFARAYLEAGDPASPYQHGAFSTDPVCGMTVHHTSAAEVLVHEGRRYYVCATSCAELFRQNPDDYTRTPTPNVGGAP